MGPIEAAVTPGGVGGLFVEISLLFLNFYAVSRIITKAGYSAKWILVPLAPVCLWFVSFLVLVIDVRSTIIGDTTVSAPVRLGDFHVLEIFDFLSVVVAWVFFMIFAFSTWPVSTARREPRGFPPNQPTAFVPAGRAPGATLVSAAMIPGPADLGHAPFDLSAAPPPPPPHTAVTPGPQSEQESPVIYCSWCGKERAVDAQAIHHCGSRDRPPVYCMNCGIPLEVGVSNCAKCGTPTTKLSR